MPYKTDGSDAPANVPADKKKQWAAVWNDVYERALKAGKSKDEAEKLAFEEANGVIKKEAKAMIIKLSKAPISFKADVSGSGILALDIFDVIGQNFLGEGITSSMMSEALKEDGYNSITLNLNSPGGDLFEGVAIYNLLKASGKNIDVNVIGLAASAASLIAMAGNTITMQLGTQMMIHNAFAMTAGSADDFRKMADTLDSVSASAADLYVAKTGMSKDKVLKMMADETWMNPEEAMENGFATAVGKEKAMQNSFNLSVFKNTPIELQAKTKRVANEDLTAACFIYVGDPDKTDTWALPWHFSTEEKTQSHLRDALARFDQETVIPESHKAECYAKLVRLCKEHGIEVSDKKAATDYKIDLLRKRIEVEKRK